MYHADDRIWDALPESSDVCGGVSGTPDGDSQPMPTFLSVSLIDRHTAIATQRSVGDSIPQKGRIVPAEFAVRWPGSLIKPDYSFVPWVRLTTDCTRLSFMALPCGVDRMMSTFKLHCPLAHCTEKPIVVTLQHVLVIHLPVIANELHK